MSTRTSDATPASVSQHATHSPAHSSAPSPAQLPDFKRRRFLAALGAGGAGAAAMATQSVAAPLVPAVAPVDAETTQGYRETEHIRDYYATTRI